MSGARKVMRGSRRLVRVVGAAVCVGLLLCGGWAGLSAASPQVKGLLQDALRLYGERQYVRALDLFKQVHSLDPTNAIAAQYIESAQERILEWELTGAEKGQETPSWDSLLQSQRGQGSVETHANARDIIAARRALVDRMRTRSSNTDNIVQMTEDRRGLRVTLFHDQLFLPGLRTLRDEALPILANVADVIRTGPDRGVVVESVARHDSKDPHMLYPSVSGSDMAGVRLREESAFLFQDLESVRALILFTHIAREGLGSRPGTLR